MNAKETFVIRIRALPQEYQKQVAAGWPNGVPSLKKDGHSPEELRAIHDVIAAVETEYRSASAPAESDDEFYRRIHAACSDAFENDDEKRHALIGYATSGAATSSKGLSAEQAEAVVAAAAEAELDTLLCGEDEHGVFWYAEGSEPVRTWPRPPAPVAAPAQSETLPQADAVSIDDESPIDWKTEAKSRKVTQANLLAEIVAWSGTAYPKLAEVVPSLGRRFLAGLAPFDEPAAAETAPAKSNGSPATTATATANGVGHLVVIFGPSGRLTAVAATEPQVEAVLGVLS